MKKAIWGLVLSVVIFGSGAPAQGHDPKSRVDIRIVPDQGKSFTAIPYQEFQAGKTRVSKRYLEARKGEQYSIFVRNSSPDRIGVVLAVDGRNIITGKKSNLTSSETMYIVGPHETSKLDGWRTDQDTVHRFYFTDMPDSYSVRTFSDASAMGVIAAAVYREKKMPVRLFKERQESTGAAAAPEAKRSLDDSAGTGFGNEKYAPVVTVEFEPEQIPAEKILVQYEWREALCRKGLLGCEPENKNRLWDEDAYAPFPPGYAARQQS